MPGRREKPTLRRRDNDRSGVTLAIYHASRDFERHIAALRRSDGFRLTCVPQRSSSRLSTRGLDGVLWELTSAQRPNRRRLAALARAVPVVSYSADASRAIADQSRAIGFVSHLKAPLRPAAVRRQFAPSAGPDLAERLRVAEGPLRRQLRKADLFAEFVAAVTGPLEPARVAEAVVTRVAGWLPAPGWAIVAVDHEGLPALLGAKLLTDELESAAQAVGLWVLAQEAAFFSASVADDRRVTARAGAVVALPLTARGRTVGALVGLDRAPAVREPRLSGATQATFGALLEPAALALDTSLRIARAEALSVTDDLTQLYNSRYLSQVLRRETKRASRSGRPLSLLFIDLDGFKSVNDVHGHLCGSQALVEVAAVIRSTARETDVVARFGGDEFALVLPDTGSEGAVAVGERVRDRIAEAHYLGGQGLDVRLTASVGVATLPDVAASSEGLMRAADQAMYWVKEHGKNGISVFTSP